MIKNFAIFDIDKTIIKSDSMFDLLKYTTKKYPKSKKTLPLLFIKLVLFKLKLINTKKAKEAMFYTLNYVTNDDLNDFYSTVLKNKIFTDAKKKMEELKKQDYIILLVSASPEAYLKYFAQENYVDAVIGTKFELLDTKTTNRIQGENCKGYEKVKRINEYLKKNNLEINKSSSFAFSDSLSDTPMFELTDNAFLINYKKANNKYKILKWS
ncbi:MAG: HAD family hydrolase [Sarcina sp.]